MMETCFLQMVLKACFLRVLKTGFLQVLKVLEGWAERSHLISVQVAGQGDQFGLQAGELGVLLTGEESWRSENGGGGGHGEAGGSLEKAGGGLEAGEVKTGGGSDWSGAGHFVKLTLVFSTFCSAVLKPNLDNGNMSACS